MRVKEEKQSVIMEIIKRFSNDLKEMIKNIISLISEFLSTDEKDPSLEEVLESSGMSEEEKAEVMKSIRDIEQQEKELLVKDKKRKKKEIEKEKEEKLKTQTINNIQNTNKDVKKTKKEIDSEERSL